MKGPPPPPAPGMFEWFDLHYPAPPPTCAGMVHYITLHWPPANRSTCPPAPLCEPASQSASQPASQPASQRASKACCCHCHGARATLTCRTPGTCSRAARRLLAHAGRPACGSGSAGPPRQQPHLHGGAEHAEPRAGGRWVHSSSCSSSGTGGGAHACLAAACRWWWCGWQRSSPGAPATPIPDPTRLLWARPGARLGPDGRPTGTALSLPTPHTFPCAPLGHGSLPTPHIPMYTPRPWLPAPHLTSSHVHLSHGSPPRPTPRLTCPTPYLSTCAAMEYSGVQWSSLDLDVAQARAGPVN